MLNNSVSLELLFTSQTVKFVNALIMIMCAILLIAISHLLRWRISRTLM